MRHAATALGDRRRILRSVRLTGHAWQRAKFAAGLSKLSDLTPAPPRAGRSVGGSEPPSIAGRFAPAPRRPPPHAGLARPVVPSFHPRSVPSATRRFADRPRDGVTRTTSSAPGISDTPLGSNGVAIRHVPGCQRCPAGRNRHARRLRRGSRHASHHASRTSVGHRAPGRHRRGPLHATRSTRAPDVRRLLTWPPQRRKANATGKHMGAAGSPSSICGAYDRSGSHATARFCRAPSWRDGGRGNDPTKPLDDDDDDDDARYPGPARTFCETSTRSLCVSVAGPDGLVES